MIDSVKLKGLVDNLNEQYGNELANPCTYQYSDGVDFIYWNDICLWNSENEHMTSFDLVKQIVQTNINKILHPIHLEYIEYLFSELKYTFKDDTSIVEKLDEILDEELLVLSNGCSL